MKVKSRINPEVLHLVKCWYTVFNLWMVRSNTKSVDSRPINNSNFSYRIVITWLDRKGLARLRKCQFLNQEDFLEYFVRRRSRRDQRRPQPLLVPQDRWRMFWQIWMQEMFFWQHLRKTYLANFCSKSLQAASNQNNCHLRN